MNQHHWTAIGTVLLCLGIFFANVQGVTLNEPTHKVAMDMTKESEMKPPRHISFVPWLRYAFISAGAVLLLHAVAMKKPGK